MAATLAAKLKPDDMEEVMDLLLGSWMMLGVDAIVENLGGSVEQQQADRVGHFLSLLINRRDGITISPGAARWLAIGERGSSSEALFSMTTGLDIRGPRHINEWRHPLDPDDFQRCERMLRMVPEARHNLHRAKARTPEWEILVDHWYELVDIMEKDVPGVFEGANKTGASDLGYQRMKELFELVEQGGEANEPGT